MRKLLLLSLLITATLTSFSQLYNPALHTVTNKALGVAQAASTDARSLYFDVPTQRYRPFASTAEVLTYLYLPKYRSGYFDVIVNSGGTLDTGVVTGGVNSVYWFRNGTADGNLVLKLVDEQTFYNVNRGPGYKWAIENTNDVKTIVPGYGQRIDSATTDAITIAPDTSVLFPALRATIPAISVDTSSLSARINRGIRIVTIAQLRALSNPSDSSIYYMRDHGKEGMWYWDAADLTSVDDTGTIVTQGSGGAKRVYKRIFERKVYPEWWGAVGDNATNDGPYFNQMFRWMERTPRGSYEVGFLHNTYFTSTRIDLPKLLETLPNLSYPFLLIDAYGVAIRINSAIDAIWRMPLTDGDVSLMNNNYKMVIKGLYIYGDRATVGQTGMRLGTCYGCQFEDIHIVGVDTGVVASFFTLSKFENLFCTVNLSTDVIFQSLAGLVGAQTVAGSATNFTIMENVRLFKNTASYAGGIFLGTDNTKVVNTVVEGSQPRYGFYSDFQGSSVSNTLIFDDIWFEGNSSSPSVNFRIAGSGFTIFQDVQRTYQDTLFDFTGSQATATFLFERFTYAGNMSAKPFKADPSNPQMSGQFIQVTGSDPNFSTLLYTAASWVGGIVPYNLWADNWLPANGGYNATTSSGIYRISPQLQSAEGSGYVQTRGNLIGVTDDVNYIGGVPGANFRYKGAYFGTGGVFTDPTSGFRFGTALSAGDLRMVRDSVGQLGIMSDGIGTYANIKLARGQFSTRTGYTATRTFASLGTFDFPAKEHMTIPNITGLQDSLTSVRSAAVNIYNANGSLTANRTMTMAGFNLNLTGGWLGLGIAPTQALQVHGQLKIDTLNAGASTDSVLVTSSGVTKRVLQASVNNVEIVGTATDANFTLGNETVVILPVVTANRTLTFSSAVPLVAGRMVTLVNKDDNATLFGWSFPASTTNLHGSSVSAVPNTATTRMYYTGSAWVTLGSVGNPVITTSSAALSMFDYDLDYVFTGTTGTLLLPILANTKGVRYFIKNRGSGNLTIDSNTGGNDIYTTSAVATYVIAAGGSAVFFNDGTYFVQE